MSESSEDIGNTMPPVTLQEITTPDDPNKSFYLKMKPFVAFKLAIEALLDTNFSDDGHGMVSAASDSLAISVVRYENDTADTVDATATLLLKSSGRIEFQNNENDTDHTVDLWTPLRLINQRFPLDRNGDDDFVVLYHLKGTNALRIWFGPFGNGVEPPTGTEVDIVKCARVTMFPNLTVLGEITVPVSDIIEMCECMERLPEDDLSDDTVFIDWKDGFATFQIGSGEIEQKWEYQYNQNERTFQVWFDWYFMTFIEKASSIADRARVLFLTVPEQHVLFQFHIGEESADLFLLQKARFEMSAEDEDVVSNSVTLDTLSNSWLQ
ncbi:uncharacterized protein LOC141645845 [Silene latifolia]|uniref:uncharacterized protein LOC141645845 n=1 Tax=Silene latifolia TaxID=37657 RepID=UPI003D779043